ncbi:MAG: glycosyltransferase [Alphaproteobacteria bacterium]|nr:glycosyltransferase [Alphaproteobacteria bacterium]
MADFILASVAIFLVGAALLHVITIVIVSGRLIRSTRPQANTKATEGVSLLRPVCGLDHELEATLRSSFRLTYEPYEIIFCVASPEDAALPLLRKLIDEYPDIDAKLLIGDERISGNPKLNNLVKGWAAAQYDWIVMTDSNVLLPQDYMETLLSRWDAQTGLVSSPPVGIGPDGLWGALECAFLNTYQARWQLVADQLGFGFAQGKTLFWRRDILESGGGLAALGQDMAEDVASTKLVRRAGLKVRVAKRPFVQPIGRRRLQDVWQRQLRWSRVRRLGFLPIFLPELFSGGAAPLIAALILMWQGALPPACVLAIGLLWYGAEFVFAWLARWPHAPRDILAWGLRDLMIPALWIAGWASNDFAWRGNDMTADEAGDK